VKGGEAWRRRRGGGEKEGKRIRKRREIWRKRG